VDCHCHLAENFFYKRIDELMQEWTELGIKKIGSMATNLRSARRNLELHLRYPQQIVVGIGRHPWGAHKTSQEELDKFEHLIREIDHCIVGEIGLDYYFVKEEEKQKKQTPIFKAFIEFAIKYEKPVMLHTTGAESAVFDLLSTYELKSNICCHWFSGSQKILQNLIDLGCYFSINPAFLRSINHKRVLEKVPLERLLTESDGNVKFQGKPGSPALMPFMCEKIAHFKNISELELKERIFENFLEYLGK
ncbi:MAG: TatD family hydrolase, partial [Candidatus Heimdallarchaeota archaeon]